MTVISSRVFLQNPVHYFNLALKERVAVKRGKNVFCITPKEKPYTNTIDPEDPYWDDERNYDEFIRRINMTEEENPVVATLRTSEDIKKFLGLSSDDI